MINVVSQSAEQTKLLGQRFSEVLAKQDIILLEGELGGGKTTFVQGLVAGFGFRGQVLSPSFTLVRQYKVKKVNIYHLDLYRLTEKDFSSIDMQSYLYDREGVSVIEWGKKIESHLDRYLVVSFLFLGMNKRRIKISHKGYKKDKLKNLAELKLPELKR